MSWIVYRDSDNCVLNNMKVDPTATLEVGQSTTEITPDPTFTPPFTTHKWTITLPSTFTLIGQFANVPSTGDHHTQTGAMVNMSSDGTEYGRWGDSVASSGVTMLRDGQLVGFSAALDDPRTSGSTSFRITIDGVEQNMTGFTFSIDGTNTISNFLEFETVIEFTAGQIISIVAKGSGFAPSSADAAISFWYRDK